MTTMTTTTMTTTSHLLEAPTPGALLHQKKASTVATSTPADGVFASWLEEGLDSPTGCGFVEAEWRDASPPAPEAAVSPALPPPKYTSTGAAGGRRGPRLTIECLPEGTLLSIFNMVWSGRPSYGENDGRRQLGDIALVCKQWRDLANSDELWKPLCIARWPWLKSLKDGPSDLLPPLAAYKNTGEHRSPSVWHEFCMRHGRTMDKAGIGRRAPWSSEYTLSVEIFDRKGGFRLFCSYGRVNITSQGLSQDGRWLSKLAITGFASCWHFSAASRDQGQGRFENIRQVKRRKGRKGVHRAASPRWQRHSATFSSNWWCVYLCGDILRLLGAVLTFAWCLPN